MDDLEFIAGVIAATLVALAIIAAVERGAR